MKRFLAVLSFLVFSVPLWGQQHPQGDDPIAQSLFPPELVMRFHEEIALDDNQSKAIKDLVQKAQTRFLDMQWDMQSEAKKLSQLLKARPADETAILSQVDRVLNLEREIKKAQISLLVRIKNTLTEAQQNKLMELRHQP